MNRIVFKKLRYLHTFCGISKRLSIILIILLAFMQCKNEKMPRSKRYVNIKKDVEKDVNFRKPYEKKTGYLNNVKVGCNYTNKFDVEEVRLFLPTYREVDEVKKILMYTGVPLNFEIYSANIHNALATIIDNRRYIIYDQNLLSLTDHNSKTYWTSISILAHEIGHHLAGHTLNESSARMQGELDADKFSGFILYKMGCNLDVAIKAMQLLGAAKQSDTHPGRQARINAIKTGWEEANRLRFAGAIPPAPPDFDKEDTEYLEYGVHELVKEGESYQGLLRKARHPRFVSPILEGILLESNLPIPGTEADPEYAPLVLITNNIPDYKKEKNALIGQKVLINVDGKSTSIGSAGWSWVISILVPGRRIRFAYQQASPDSVKTFVYLKALPSLKSKR